MLTTAHLALKGSRTAAARVDFVVSAMQGGHVVLGNSEEPQCAFTQQDMMDGRVRFARSREPNESPFFNFTVTDGATGLVVHQQFKIVNMFEEMNEDFYSIQPAVLDEGSDVSGGHLDVDPKTDDMLLGPESWVPVRTLGSLRHVKALLTVSNLAMADATEDLRHRIRDTLADITFADVRRTESVQVRLSKHLREPKAVQNTNPGSLEFQGLDIDAVILLSPDDDERTVSFRIHSALASGKFLQGLASRLQESQIERQILSSSHVETFVIMGEGAVVGGSKSWNALAGRGDANINSKSWHFFGFWVLLAILILVAVERILLLSCSRRRQTHSSKRPKCARGRPPLTMAPPARSPGEIAASAPAGENAVPVTGGQGKTAISTAQQPLHSMAPPKTDSQPSTPANITPKRRQRLKFSRSMSPS